MSSNFHPSMIPQPRGGFAINPAANASRSFQFRPNTTAVAVSLPELPLSLDVADPSGYSIVMIGPLPNNTVGQVVTVAEGKSSAENNGGMQLAPTTPMQQFLVDNLSRLWVKVANVADGVMVMIRRASSGVPEQTPGSSPTKDQGMASSGDGLGGPGGGGGGGSAPSPPFTPGGGGGGGFGGLQS